MIIQPGKKCTYIIVDINTQKDFFLGEGNRCIRDHRRILAHIRRIMAWARSKHITIISICEIHPPDNSNDNNCCIEGTDGQKKIRYTLLRNRFSFPASNNTDLSPNLLLHYQQIILQNRSLELDPFNEPRIERLLSEVRAEEFILIGAIIEGAVLKTALGLLQRGKRVKVVANATGYHNKRNRRMALRMMNAKGAKIIMAEKLVGVSRLRQVGLCRCPACRSKKKAVSKAVLEWIH